MGASGRAGFWGGRSIDNITQRPREARPFSGPYGARRGSSHVSLLDIEGGDPEKERPELDAASSS